MSDQNAKRISTTAICPMTSQEDLHTEKKITRPYVAIRLEHVASDWIRCKARKDIDIVGENGGEVHIKAGETFYLARSRSLGDNMFYFVRCTLYGEKKCSCMAEKPCRHEKGVKAREEVVQEKWVAWTLNEDLSVPQPAQMPAAKRAPVATKRIEHANLNRPSGSSGGFLDVCFGRSADGAKFRAKYVANLQKEKERV